MQKSEQINCKEVEKKDLLRFSFFADFSSFLDIFACSEILVSSVIPVPNLCHFCILHFCQSNTFQTSKFVSSTFSRLSFGLKIICDVIIGKHKISVFSLVGDFLVSLF